MGDQIGRISQYSTHGFQFNGVAKPQAEINANRIAAGNLAAPDNEA
jgi:hypothetical protein